MHKIKQVRIHFAVEFCERGTGGGTVVGLSTDPAPLIISNFLKYRVLWSLSKSMIIIKCMLSVRNQSKTF